MNNRSRKPGCLTTLIVIGFLVYLYLKYEEGSQIDQVDAVESLIEYLIGVGVIGIILTMVGVLIGTKLVKSIIRYLKNL